MKIGDKVVCVDDRGFTIEDYTNLPVKGRIYVTRLVEPDPKYPTKTRVLLLGVNNPWNPEWNCEYGFFAFRFRLLDEMKEESRNKHIEAQGSEIPMESLSADTLYPPILW